MRTVKKNTFLGLGMFPDDIQEALIEAQHIISCSVPSHLWENMTLTADHNLHITLKFMGYQTRFDLNDVHSHLEKSRFQLFPLTLKKFGYFQLKNQTYIWAGVKHSDALISFQNNLDKIVEQRLGMPLKGTYTPHITLMRLKGASEDDVKSIMKNLPHMPELTFTPSKYYLYQTENDANGHKVYLPVERYGFV
jgi:2'-5' RNA ligase